MQGFRLSNTHKLYARRRHGRRPDGAGDDYNPSLYGLGLKMIPKRLNTNPHPKIPKLCIENVGKVNFKSVYSHLIEFYHNVPTSENKWIEYYINPFLESVHWKRVYSLSSQRFFCHCLAILNSA